MDLMAERQHLEHILMVGYLIVAAVTIAVLLWQKRRNKRKGQ